MAENSLLSRLDGIDARFEEVSTLITDPSVIADMKRYVRLNKEYKDLERLTSATNRYRALLANIAEAKELLESETDSEMREMAHEQLDEANDTLPQLEEEIKLLLIPADPEDAKNAIAISVAAQVATKPLCLRATCSKCIHVIANQRAGRLL